MNGFNKVILAGNLTRDPELRYTTSGTAVAKAGLAINRKWRDSQSGEMKEEVTFVDITAFGKLAENFGDFKRKGEPILVEGRLHLEQWDDRQTQQKRSKLGVIAESINFLPTPNDGSEAHERNDQRRPDTEGAMKSWSKPPAAKPGQQAQRSFTGGGYSGGANDLPPEEDDIPF